MPAHVLFDFEQTGLSNRWRVVGSTSVSRLPLPEDAGDGRDGAGVRVRVGRPARLVTHPGCVPGDWRPFEAISMWIYRAAPDADERPTESVDVVVHEVDDNASFRRRVDLTGTGWTRIELPLRWFRWGDGRVPRWDRIDRLSLAFRDPGEYWIDDITLLPSSAPPQLRPTADELIALAESADEGAGAAVYETADVLLVSTAPALDAVALDDHLARVRAAVFDELPWLASDTGPVPLVVLRDRDAYAAFVRALAEAYSGVVDPPGHDGYSMLGFGMSAWSDEHGTLRPSYAHEYVHAALSAAAGLPSRGEWLHEGLATRYQLRFHPDAGLDEVVRRGLASPARRLPLPELCDGTPIPIDRYGQAMTVVDLLVDDPRYRDHLPALLEAFRASGSTDLAPHLGTVLGVDWAAFEADWRRFTEGRDGTAGDG